jgi:hypothetical protein
MPGIGQFVLHSMANPPLKAGDYTLHGHTDTAGGPTADYDAHIRVTSPRFALPPDQMLSTFPPANSEGAYETRLPQIVLKRRTLPWERSAAPGDTTTPWLALVVIAEGEATLSGDVPIAQCVTPGLTLQGPSDVATGTYLSVTRTVVNKIFPTKPDVPLLCHVREVDVNDTELANGDDDGFLAVVMANRLPQYDRTNDAPVRYLACLINLEGQLDVLPPPQPPFNLQFLATASVFDYRALDSGPPPDIDRVVMGGSAPLLAGGGAAAAPIARAAKPAALGAAQTMNKTWATTTTKVERAALTSPAGEAGRVVRDVMLEGFRGDLSNIVLIEPIYRFPVLTHWSFTVNGAGGFDSLMEGLDVGLLGTAPRPAAVPPGAPPPPPAPRPAPEFTETGHVGLPHLTRRGERVRAWYRGPLSSHPTTRDVADADGHFPFANVSDQLRRVVPDGREDLSLAGAFEIGRLLALSQPSVVRALLAWRAEQFGAERAKQIVAAASEAAAIAAAAAGTRAHDLGALIGRNVVLAAANRPDKVLAPNRPLVDPGRPLPFASQGGIEVLLAQGFGFAAQDVAKRATVLGPVVALQQTAVPIAVAATPGPVLEGPAVAHLQARLANVVDGLTQDALRQAPGAIGSAGGRPRARTTTAAPDALDELIARARQPRRSPSKPARKPRRP